MVRHATWLAIVLTLPALAGCSGPSSPTAEAGHYLNRANRFEMQAPPGWTIRESGGTAAVLMTAPGAGEAVRPNLNVVVEDRYAGLTLEEAAERCKTQVASLRGFELLAPEQSITLADGLRAIVIAFRQAATGTPLAQRQMVVVGGGRTYVVTATASPETFAAEEKNFDACFRSFRAGL